MQQIKIWIILISVWFTIAAAYPAIKIAVETIPPILLEGIKSIFGGMLLFLIFKVSQSKFFRNRKIIKDSHTVQENEQGKNIGQIISKNQWKTAIIISIALVVGGRGLIAFGEQYLSSDLSVLVYSTVPIWTIVLGNILYNFKLNKFTLLGIFIGMIGFVILLFPTVEALFYGTQNSTVRFEIFGIISLLVAAISWSIGSLYSNKTELPNSILLSTGMWLFAGGLLSIVVSIIIGELNTFELLEISFSSLVALLYLCTISTLGIAGYFWILRKTTPILANTFAYVSPTIAIFLGWAILDENINFRMIIATIIILVGVIIIVNRDKISTKNKRINSHNGN
ncbi:MAG: EamA family transporter [Nitrososphaeraceae archaeon]